MPTVSQDTNSSGVALTYATDGLTWIVPRPYYVWGNDVGIESTHTGNTLVNRSAVLGGITAVEFSGDGLIRNTVGGSIMGNAIGIMFNASTHSRIDNLGKVVGLNEGVRYMADADAMVLNNTGELYGTLYAVRNSSTHSGGTIVNSGWIHSAVIATIYFNGASGLVAHITNNSTGLISGPNTVIFSGGAALDLSNFGSIRGLIQSVAPATHDVVLNHGKIAGAVRLGPGNDTFNGNGGMSGRVFGEADNDRLSGGSLGDWLDGGAGRDVLTGRAAADRFHVTVFTDTAPGALRDLITDFNHAQHDCIDLADLSGGTFTFRGAQPFTGTAPEVRFGRLNPAGTANDKTIISGDVDGNGTTDFQIELRGLHNLVAGDFVL